MTGSRAVDVIQRVAIILAAVLAAGSLIVGVFALATGRSTNHILDGQAEASATSDCRSTYAVADRVSSSNLDVTKSEVLSLFAKAAIIGETDSLREQFRQAKRRDDKARAERIAIAAIQADSITNCDPDRPGGIKPAPIVDPIHALEEDP